MNTASLPFQLLFAFLKIAIMVGFLFNVGALLTWVDRRQSAMIQDRIGPNRAVIKIPFLNIELRVLGLIHTAADGLKFFFKEDFIPPNADKLLFGLAPILAMAPVLALIAVIPFGDVLDLNSIRKFACVGADGHLLNLDHGQCLDAARRVVDGVTPSAYYPAVPRFGTPANAGGPVELIVAPLSVGVLYVFALAGQGIVGAAIAGWSSDNKFSLMGALRAASQMVSYEVAMGLSLVGAMMLYGTVRLDDMVRWQGENCWGIFTQPLAFFLFFIAAVAESKRIPFDLPEAESELVSGYFTEYSGMKFGMFYFAEYMEVATSSMLLVTIFLGGWQLPFIHRDGLSIEFGTLSIFHTVMPHIWVTILQVLTFFGKVLAVCSFQAFVRWSLPRFRYDQLMKIGWRVLLPLSLANIFVTGCLLLGVMNASFAVQAGLKIAADVTQGLVALAITSAVIALAFGMLKPRAKSTWIVGSSAHRADLVGGTKETAMQA
jgi:NADH-quinone oxidoreductase subunit H